MMGISPMSRNGIAMRPTAVDTDLGELLAWAGSRFHVWREELRGNKLTKVPYRPGGGNAKSNDPTTWVPFETAKAVLGDGRYTGLAFQLGELPDGRWVIGIDLDLCRNADGTIHGWAAEILRRLPTYAEVSPSGSGVKLLGLVDWLPDCLGAGGMEAGVDNPEPLLGHATTTHEKPEIGLYPSKRFFALTGQRLECTPDELCDVTEAFAQLALELRQSTPARAALAVDASDIELTRGTFSAELLQRILDHPLAGPRWRNDDRCDDRSRCDFRLAEDMTLDFTQDEVEAAIRQYPYGQIGSGKLTGYAADRQIKRLIVKAKTNVPEKVDFTPLLPPHDPETGEIFEEPAAPQGVTERDTEAPTSEIDDLVAGAGGLLGDLVRWMTTTARYPQPLLSLGAALTMCGALMGHRYRLLDGPDTRSNIMVLGLAGSGSGKDHPRRCVIKALSHAGLDRFYHGRSIASAQGIIGSLSAFYSGVMLLDEAGLFFAGMMDARAPAYIRNIGALLMELSTSASITFHDAAKAGDRDPDTVRYDIPDPCFNLFATTVPEPFWDALNSGAADGGFLARFLLFETPLNYPDPQFDIAPMDEGLDAISAQMRQMAAGPGVRATDLSVAAALGALQPRWEKNGDKRIRLITSPEVPVVPMSACAVAADRELAMAEVQRKRALEGKSLATSIVARTTEHARRLALIRAVSRDPLSPTVEAEDMHWAAAVVGMSQKGMIGAVEQNIADSQWEANLKRLLKIIRKHGGWIDMSTLSDRCYFLKARDRNEGIAQLLEGGKLEIRKEPTATKTRTFVRITGGHR